MATSLTENTVRFGLFELDLKTGQLTRDGAKIRLQQQPFQILSMLIQSPGEIVTRDQLRRHLWPSDVFVDFDRGLNKSIQKLRDALRDSAGSPHYIETIPRLGYRFIAPVTGAIGNKDLIADAGKPQPQKVSVPFADARPALNRRARWFLLAACIVGVCACVALAFGRMARDRSLRRPAEVTFTQLTDFTDSAVAPALSPDGRMIAFIRGGNSFLSSDRIYVKMLPNGEARKITDDDRPKYGLAFSPDASEVAYTVLEPSGFSTYEVSALGGEPHLLLPNAAGLMWLDSQRLLFSQASSGIHLGLVTSTATRAGLREIYLPQHQRGMVHYAFPSPDHRWALVVEMNGSGDWAPCRLVPLEDQGSSTVVGPADACTSAGWSPDGNWMYFTATVKGKSHIWRQRFPEGAPEQITFGPTEEDGIAVESDGRALITSLGVQQSSVWIHDSDGERPLSSEGEVDDGLSPPVFGKDNDVLYYLLRRGEGSGAELLRTVVNSKKSDSVFPGISMAAFDVSPDGKQVVYSTAESGGTTQLWLAPLDLSVPPRMLGIAGARSPHFGPGAQILFEKSEGNENYLERIDLDGSHHARVFPFPILQFQGVSPGRRWVIAGAASTPEGNVPSVLAIPLDGGAARRLCAGYCRPHWSTDGKFLFVTVDEPSRMTPGRSLAIPIGPAESLPDLPAGGISPMAQPSAVRAAEVVARGEVVPGQGPEQYAWVNTTVLRNLYRISLP